MDSGERTCGNCGDVLSPMKRQGNPKKYCSERCRVSAYRASNAAYAERQRARSRAVNVALEAAKPPRPRCASCGKEMQRRATSRYCSEQPCRTAKYYATLDDLPRCSRESCDSPAIAKGLCGSHYAREWAGRNPERSRDHRRARRARLRDARVEHVDFAEVLARDAWMCGLCSEPIPRDAVWPDRLTASLDHVIPLSRGGEHSMGNVQASHLGCNSSKGNRLADVAVMS